MSSDKKPDSRLLSALPYIKHGGVIADIGTDHAYLPIEAMKQGLVRRAIACDINKGPIESAKAHIREAGLAHCIDTLQTDGLHGVEVFSPDDILIFGMGGELIIRILSEAPWIKREGIGLILQPMTHPELLRRWLLQEGFFIAGESLTYEEQYYQTIFAVYGKENEAYTQEELYFGKYILQQGSPFLRGMLLRRSGILISVIEGKKKGNAAAAEEEALLQSIQKRLSAMEEEA